MKKLNILLAVLLVAVLGFGAFAAAAHTVPAAEIIVVTPPPQSEPIVPEWAKPAEAPEVDFGENIAFKAQMTTTGFVQSYKADLSNDGSLMTYWEAKEFPGELTAQLDDEYSIGHVVIRLNPAAIWAVRTQNIEVQRSADGELYTQLLPAADYGFDPSNANTVVITVPAWGDALPTARFIRLIFHSNTGATGGQAAELELYTQ